MKVDFAKVALNEMIQSLLHSKRPRDSFMKKLIRKLILRATTGIIAVTSLTLAIFALVIHSIQNIEHSFYLSALVISAAPGLTFMAAFGYHFMVVGPIKQLCAIEPRNLSEIQKALIDSAQEIIGFSRLIPIVFSFLALAMAIIVVPGLLIVTGIDSGNIVKTTIVSIFISTQAVLAIRIVRQIHHAIQYIRGLA